jgi:dTDP-4-amino-4,6-dideoxy-D-galactose acyltransferase
MVDFEILKWDSDFFGFKIAKINNGTITTNDFDAIFNELKKLHVKLVYWPSNIDHSIQAELHNKYNGILVDTKTTYEINFYGRDIPVYKKSPYVEFYNNPFPDPRLIEIAIQCGEYSRFKVDTNIPYQKFAALYTAWITNSINRSNSDKVIITKHQNLISGLVTVNCNEGSGNIGLVGVHEYFRGQGIGGLLISASLNYFIKNKCSKAYVVTQGNNEAACKLYEKFGFKINNKVHFYHFWLK